MSWRYRKYRSTRSYGSSRSTSSYSRPYQPKFFFSEKEIDFTAGYLDYSQFLLQEFFTADLETRQKLSAYYIHEYGSRSFAYLKRKYAEWASGDYHLTDLMKERIISMMPKFLNDEAKHKLGIHEFMSAIKNTIASFERSQKTEYGNSSHLKQPHEVLAIFQNQYEKIQDLSIRNFRYNVLTEEEKEEALEISKYILKVKLQKAFDQIERDFNTFLPFMVKFWRGFFSASYSITAFNLKVDLTNAGFVDIELPKFHIDEAEANSRFKEYSDKYLAYELVSIQKESKEAIKDSFLNSSDIQLFFEHYSELLKSDSEVSMNSTFQGEGGVLTLKAEMKSLKLLTTSIVISSTKLTFYLIVIVTSVLMAITHGLLILLIFIALFVGEFVLNLVGEEIFRVRSLINEFKKYGQQRSTS